MPLALVVNQKNAPRLGAFLFAFLSVNAKLNPGCFQRF